MPIGGNENGALGAGTSRDGQTSVLPSHPAGNINPRVSSRAVNGDLRGQKRRIRKGADCHRNHVRQIPKLPVQGRTATGAEVIGDDLTAVADPRVRAGRACDLYLASGISRLNAKGAACPPLASQTVTNRNANGITLNIEGKLSAATACLARSHTLYSETNRQFQWTLACLESSSFSARCEVSNGTLRLSPGSQQPRLASAIGTVHDIDCARYRLLLGLSGIMSEPQPLHMQAERGCVILRLRSRTNLLEHFTTCPGIYS